MNESTPWRLGPRFRLAALTLVLVLGAPALRGDEDPIIFGEDIDDACPIDVDIHLPAAQNPAQPLVVEGLDATQGSWTLRNDDMDPATDEIIASRLQNPTDLLRAEGRPDLAVAGAVAGENDLVAVDLHNPTVLGNVFLNVYAMAAQNGASTIATHSDKQPANRIARRLAVWRASDRAVAVDLPVRVAGPGPERIWVEGLGAGRYRLVLMYIPNGTAAQAGLVKASEGGSPHGQVTAGTVTLTPPAGVAITCHRNVRLTVAVADIEQRGRRQHLFDVLWGGRPVFDARLWPGGGAWRWGQSAGLNGAWLQGVVHGANVAPNGQAPAGHAAIREAQGALEPVVEGVGQLIAGSGRYEHRLRLEYQVEGVTLTREEPLTLMVPHHITFTPLGDLAAGVTAPHWGTAYSFTLAARYQIFDQHDRLLVGPGPAAYRRQYGASLRAYEALGMGLQATENGDAVRWTYVSPILATRTFNVPIGTKQRSRAVPQNGTLSDATFTDAFGLTITSAQRGMLQQDIRENNNLASRPVFSVSQDVVVLLSNGVTDYDVRVARGQRLEILAPRAPAAPGAPWGGMGFQLTLGNGAQPDTGRPDRVASAHNPPPP